MGSSDFESVCPICPPGSSFPSAFSSQAEWDSVEESRGIDIPILASRISLVHCSTKSSTERGQDYNFFR